MKFIFLFVLIFCTTSALLAQTAGTDKQLVLDQVRQFFIALEKQDSVTFRNLHTSDARLYWVTRTKDSIRTGSRASFDFPFDPKFVITERMQEEKVKTEIHGDIAMVWAPYDLWANNVFSHCGIDVFTLLRTPQGWKIANCTFTMEKEGCGTPEQPR
jgi:hypothetical protein